MLFKSKLILIMGLGVNKQGSGLSSAIYLAKQGANLIVTDLRDEIALAYSLSLLEPYKEQITYVLGQHREEDFARADFIVKNPGVRKDSPFLKNIESSKIINDIGLFLQKNTSPIIAVTGSKGKSSVVTAIHSYFKKTGRLSYLGGNITISPLNFLHQLTGKETVILELSSWLLGDLEGKDLLKPKIAVMTNLLNDHQNYYQNNMQNYANDKAVIFANQDESDIAILNANDEWTSYFTKLTKAKIVYFSTKKLDSNHSHILYLDDDELVYEIEGYELRYAKPKCDLLDENMLIVVLTLVMYGVPIEEVFGYLPSLERPEHRLELVRNIDGISYYNDSAATMVDATIEALKKLTNVHIIMGGMDKELDFEPLVPYLSKVKSINLFSGSASDKLVELLDKYGIKYRGYFENMNDAINSARENAISGDNIVLSPAAASFNLFVNEFDRGNQFKNIVLSGD